LDEDSENLLGPLLKSWFRQMSRTAMRKQAIQIAPRETNIEEGKRKKQNKKGTFSALTRGPSQEISRGTEG